MTPKEIKSLIKTLRAAGVRHYKTPELELNLEPFPEKVSRETTKAISKVALDAPYEPDKTPEHKVEELTSLLKLSDTDLVDRLFPDFTDYGEDEEATA